MSDETNKDDKAAVNDDQEAPISTLDEANAGIEAELLDELAQESEVSEA